MAQRTKAQQEVLTEIEDLIVDRKMLEASITAIMADPEFGTKPSWIARRLQMEYTFTRR